MLYAPQFLSARARFADPVRIPLRPWHLLSTCPVLACCFTGHFSAHVAPLCAYHPATSAFRLRHVIGLPSSPIILVGFLVTSVASFDMLLIIEKNYLIKKKFLRRRTLLCRRHVSSRTWGGSRTLRSRRHVSSIRGECTCPIYYQGVVSVEKGGEIIR